MLNGWDITFLYAVFLVFLRLGALLYFMPTFSAAGVPQMTKVAFAVLFAGIVAMSLPERPALPTHAFGLVVAGLNEVLVGLLMGFVIRIAFQAVSMAGEIISLQGGFMADHSFNPMNQQSAAAMERLMYSFAVVAFLTLGLHLQVFSSFVDSFAVAKLGVWLPSQGTINGLIAATAKMFAVAVSIAAPFIAANFVINMTFAVLGKAVPQMNVFIISFAILIVAALVILGITLDVTAEQIGKYLSEAAKNVLYLLEVR